MRTLRVALALSIAGASAHADDAPAADPASASSAMHLVADDAAVCAELGGAWAPSPVACRRVRTRRVAGLGEVEAWQATSAAAQRWAVVILTGGERWMSSAIDLPGSGCGAGHCHDIETTAAIRVVHLHGRAAAVLELHTMQQSYTLEPPRRIYDRSSEMLFVGCGTAAAGERRCAPPVHVDGNCAIRLGGDGLIVQTCQSIEHIDL